MVVHSYYTCTLRYTALWQEKQIKTTSHSFEKSQTSHKKYTKSPEKLLLRLLPESLAEIKIIKSD
jgi:hypothetical protein